MTKIGYLTGMLPGSMRNGTEIATAMIATAIVSCGYRLQLFGFLRSGDLNKTPSAIAVDEIPIETGNASIWKKLSWALVSIVRNEPFSVSKFRTSASKRTIKAICSDLSFVIVDKPQMVWAYKHELSGKKISVVWHAIEQNTYSDVYQSSNGLKKLVYLRESVLSGFMERKVATIASHVFALTENDAEHIKSIGFRGQVTILPLIMPSYQHSSCHNESSFSSITGGRPFLALLGNWLWSANADGLHWFIENVVPKISTDIPILIGGNGSEAYARFAPNIFGIGKVEDAKSFLESAEMVAIPLISGTGISMKVIEAAGAGWRTVTTERGARGLAPTPPNISIASDAGDFADIIDRQFSIRSGNNLELRQKSIIWSEERESSFRSQLRSGLEEFQNLRMDSK